MPTTEVVTRGRRQLHRKAAFIAAFGVGSYVALVFAPVGLVLRVVFALMLVIASVATATNVMQWFVMSDYRTLLHRRVGVHELSVTPRKRDVALILLGKLIHLGWAILLPMALHPWWGVLGF
jgi:hypothetical protein